VRASGGGRRARGGGGRKGGSARTLAASESCSECCSQAKFRPAAVDGGRCVLVDTTLSTHTGINRQPYFYHMHIDTLYNNQYIVSIDGIWESKLIKDIYIYMFFIERRWRHVVETERRYPAVLVISLCIPKKDIDIKWISMSFLYRCLFCLE
jgi:hypothetical protein